MCEAKAARFGLGKISITLSQLFGDGALIIRQFRADVLKTSQRLHTAHAVMIGDCVLEIGGDESFNYYSVR